MSGTSSQYRRWRRDARRALRELLAHHRTVPGECFGGLLEGCDVVVIETGRASAWLVRYRPDPDQLAAGALAAVFDQVTLVVPERSVADAVGSSATQYGVYSVGHVAGRAVLAPIRQPVAQPAHDAAMLGRLLSRDDLASILRSCGRPVHPFAARGELLEQLLGSCSASGARQLILASLRT
ncbi:hypothetical protein GCM10009789_02370 [Kribbella sancticallisti]|uniref:Uncharacterized protein n=1 Tax=Kribbella sancticallisti TaxID=460087 RepID=A0ABN2C3U7_9ACTN